MRRHAPSTRRRASCRSCARPASSIPAEPACCGCSRARWPTSAARSAAHARARAAGSRARSRQSSSHVETGHGYETVYLIHPFAGQLLDLDRIRAYLVRTGESVNVAGDPKAAKIHVHNGRPDLVLRQALRLGRIVNATIMDLDHQTGGGPRGAGRACRRPISQPVPAVAADGAARVAAGGRSPRAAGDRGASRRATGWPRRWRPSASPTSGCTSPSSAAARPRTRAPGRSWPRSPPRPARRSWSCRTTRNVKLAAGQAAEMADRPVRVVPTRNAAEGIAALLEVDPGAGASGNAELMLEAGRAIQTLLVTEAVRDAVVSGRKVRRGQTMALDPDDGLLAADDDHGRAVLAGIGGARARLQPRHALVWRRGRPCRRRTPCPARPGRLAGRGGGRGPARGQPHYRVSRQRRVGERRDDSGGPREGVTRAVARGRVRDLAPSQRPPGRDRARPRGRTGRPADRA